MAIDNRKFKYAGSSADPTGEFKARFANHPTARPKVMEKAGHTNFVLVELPEPMTKLEAIRYLQEHKPEGVNLDALGVKAAYIRAQEDRANGVAKPRKARKSKTAVDPDSIVNAIVNSVRRTKKQAQATQATA